MRNIEDNFYISNYEEVRDQLEALGWVPCEKAIKTMDYIIKQLEKVNQIVRFDDFFEGLDQDIFNNIKITEGMVGILKDEYGWQCASVQKEGLPRKDGRPYKVIATYIRVVDDKPELVVKDHLVNDKDIVLFYNTAYATPDYNIYWIAKMLGETDISILKNIIYARYAPLLQVMNEKEKAQMEAAVNEIVQGEIAIMVGDDTFEELINKGQSPVINITDVSQSDKIQYLSHLYQDFIKRFSMEYGFPISGVEKMAQQNKDEINGDVAYSWLTPIDMLNQAKEGIQRCKKLWPDLEIAAHFGTLHELMYLKFAQDITKDNPDMNVSIEENQNLEDLKPMEMYTKKEDAPEDPEEPEKEEEDPKEEDPEDPEEKEEEDEEEN